MQISPRIGRQFAPLAVALCGLLASGLSAAQEDPPHAYVMSGDDTLARDGDGDCIPTINWTPEDAIEACDPELVAARDVPPPSEQAAAEPAPQEVAVAEPQIVRQRVTLETDAYFGFDSAELTDEGRERLDELAQRVNEVEEPDIQITGHTDPIGDEQYNEQLSRERAEAVRNYLVQSGVGEDAIEVAARGEEEQVVDCSGRSGQELIECLAPNRRSEVEFAAFELVEQPAEEELPGAAPVEQPEAAPGASQPTP